LAQASDFKGWTGRLAARWQATGKLGFNASAARDVGFDSVFGSVSIVPPGSPPGTLPETFLYDNNRLTYSAALGAFYSVTSKIDVTSGINYLRAEKVQTAGNVLAPVETTDRGKVFYLAASTAFHRNGTAACRLARGLRDVSGGTSYSYGYTLFGCNARFTIRG
jgi:hypothetical protein